MKTPCFKGWNLPANTTGRCCCNCKYQVEIRRHPWNQMVGGRMKGPITEIAGWGCSLPEFGAIIYFESKHSMCEMHEWKDADGQDRVLL